MKVRVGRTRVKLFHVATMIEYMIQYDKGDVHFATVIAYRIQYDQGDGP